MVKKTSVIPKKRSKPVWRLINLSSLNFAGRCGARNNRNRQRIWYPQDNLLPAFRFTHTKKWSSKCKFVQGWRLIQKILYIYESWVGHFASKAKKYVSTFYLVRHVWEWVVKFSQIPKSILVNCDTIGDGSLKFAKIKKVYQYFLTASRAAADG